MKKFCPALIYLFLVLGCLLGCNPFSNQENGKSKNPEDKDQPNQSDPIPVEVAELKRGPIEETLRLSTTLAAEAEVKVFSRSANRVTELLVEEGDVVQAGQILLRMENEIQRSAVAKAQTHYDKAQKEYERQKPLYEQELISEQAFTDVQFELKQYKIALEDAQRELAYTEVRAPINGTITHRLINLGDYATLNQHLFDLVDFTSLVARVYHPEKYLTRLGISQPARVQAAALGEKIFPAFVKRIAPVVEGQSGTVKVTLGFKDIEQLRPGMHVDTEIVLATFSNALLIPKRALVYDGDQTYVYRVQPERKVARLLVEAELTDKLNLTPTSGFQPGDQIVVAGQTGLKDGALVRLPGDPDPEEANSKTNSVEKSALLESP